MSEIDLVANVNSASCYYELSQQGVDYVCAHMLAYCGLYVMVYC